MQNLVIITRSCCFSLARGSVASLCVLDRRAFLRKPEQEVCVPAFFALKQPVGMITQRVIELIRQVSKFRYERYKNTIRYHRGHP